jgi:hypothetical protein
MAVEAAVLNLDVRDSLRIVGGLPVFADNAAAVAADRPVTSLYRKATGEVMIVF